MGLLTRVWQSSATRALALWEKVSKRPGFCALGWFLLGPSLVSGKQGFGPPAIHLQSTFSLVASTKRGTLSLMKGRCLDKTLMDQVTWSKFHDRANISVLMGFVCQWFKAGVVTGCFRSERRMTIESLHYIFIPPLCSWSPLLEKFISLTVRITLISPLLWPMGQSVLAADCSPTCCLSQWSLLLLST